MQKTELDLMLCELYNWNPKLRSKETELIKLIEVMLSARPDTKFDESFANDLKKDLLSHRILLDEEPEKNYLLFNFKTMNKKMYAVTGVLLVTSLVVLIVVPSLLLQKKQGGKIAETVTFTKVAPGAFGSLLATNSGLATDSVAAREKTLSSTGSAMPSAPKIASGVSSMMTTTSGGGSTSVASPIATRVIDSKMIAPMYSYAYVYKGEPLTFTEETGTVYRRVKGDGNLSNNLDSLISTKTFGPINLNSFTNLQTNNISLAENKKLGLMINIDFKEESVYIGENYLFWQSERDNCGENQACWDSYRLKINDIPEDATLIAKTDQFLSEKGINLEHYTAGVVDNNWRLDYAKTEDKTNYYIPEYANVVYPLVVNGQSVYEQNGNLDGLSVTVNLLQNAVSGVNNLTSYRFETSDYALETSQDKIMSLVENGGYSYSNYYGDNQQKVTLELGTPVKSLVRFWHYSNNTNDELLVPALIFPVLNAPDNYYGSKFVTVPLAKEMVDELTSQKNNIVPFNGGNPGGIMVR